MKIPDKVTLFCREYERVELMNGESKKVMPTYPAHEYSKARMEGGLKWSNQSYGGSSRKVGLFRQVEIENKFRGLYLHRLEIRGEGGRAYKVAVAGEYYVDLREDQLLDIMQYAGIEKGGYINDNFCFATVGSDFRIIRVGCDEYNELKELDGMVKATAKDMKFGSICKSGSKEMYIYLGTVISGEWEVEYKGGRYDREYKNWQNNWYSHRNTLEPALKPMTYEFKQAKEDRTQLWLNATMWQNDKSGDYSKIDLAGEDPYKFSFPKSAKRSYTGTETELHYAGKPVNSLSELLEAYRQRPVENKENSYVDCALKRIQTAVAYEKPEPKGKVKPKKKAAEVAA